jgi:hypothetical protein
MIQAITTLSLADLLADPVMLIPAFIVAVLIYGLIIERKSS